MKETSDKKFLENKFISSIVVPVAIVLIAALIIFFLTKMISVQRDYKDLVRDLHSKTFGNRWIAAYELSKKISTQKIPADEIPWLIENLEDIYNSSYNERTKHFIVVALGALKHKKAIPLILKALKEKDLKIQFSAIVALSTAPTGEDFDWSFLENF